MESNEKAKWVLQTVLDSAEAAEASRSPLCDDSGIPHLVLEIAPNRALSGRMLDEIREGVREGLRALHGRKRPYLSSAARPARLRSASDAHILRPRR